MTSAERPPLCSAVSQQLEESAYGTAATAQLWLCLEQDGPWGRAAATGSHLDPDVGRALDALAGSVGGRFALVRRPGRHPDDGTSAHRDHEVLLAWADPASPWLLRGRTRDPRDLLALDAAALTAGDLDAVVRAAPALGLVREDVPQLLVCTNGRRDLCCAVRGRPVALEAGARRPGQVWETSHTGGHRFSPTGVLLPSGQMLARLDADLALQALDAASSGELPGALHGPVHDRGRSARPGALQAAESAVRAATGETRLDALVLAATVSQDDTGDVWDVDVVHADQRAWHVTVRRVVSGPDRPESCAKAPVPHQSWMVSIAPVA